MLDAYRRVVGEAEPYDEEHVPPVTTAQGEAFFPTTGASFLSAITWVAGTAQVSLSFAQEVFGTIYERKMAGVASPKSFT